MPTHQNTFQQKFVAVYFKMLLYSWPFLILIVIFNGFRHGLDSRFFLDFLVAIVALPILLLPLTLLFKQLFAITISDEGIGCRNPQGDKKQLEWGQIDSIQPKNHLGQKYLLLSNSGQKTMVWLPLHLENQAGFQMALLNLAPPDSMIRRFFADLQVK